MKLMDAMMGKFVNRMSVEQKQDMMKKMMPMMMKDVNMAETMLKMMPAMADNISLLDIIVTFKKVLPDLIENFDKLITQAPVFNKMMKNSMGNMPKAMDKMIPVMAVLMPEMMSKMLPLILTDENRKIMSSFPDRIAPKMLENETVRELMPQMMEIFVPKCIGHMTPHMTVEKKEAFIEQIRMILSEIDNQ